MLHHQQNAASDSMITLFFNCRLLRGYELIRDELWIRGSRIIDPSTVNRQAHRKVDCHNAIICAGFLDLQVNGAFGVDFLTHPDLETGLKHVNQRLPSTGVTSYCPTLITSPPEYFHRTLPMIPTKDGTAETGAGVIGVHVEGPFISKEKKGAHPIDCIIGFGEGKMKTVEDMYGDLTNVKLITLAPEHQYADEVIRELTARGIVVSLGHSVSDLETAERAVKAGATKITHLFNAMPAFHHRDPSLPGLLASSEVPDDKPVFYGIIADGVHTHAAALRVAYRMSPKGLILLTDALGPMGLPRGEYKLGKTPITVAGIPKTAKVTGTDTLSGCVATMDYCVRHFIHVVGCSVAFALAATTLHPAQCMKITDRKGTLDFGSDADFILLNDDVRVLKTYIAGGLAFDRTVDEVVDEED